MEMSLDLLGNAVVSGLLLGGFYAAVTIGVSISFGMLDIVNIAHPAFIILGSYIAYIANTTFGIDPILASVIALPAFYLLGAAVYQVYYVAFERRGDEALRGLAFFFGLLFITEVTLVLVFGVDYRLVEAPYIGPSLHLGVVDLPLRLLVPCLVALVMIGGLQLFMSRTFLGRAILAVAQDQLALRLMAANPDPDQAHRVRAVDRHRVARRRGADRDPAGRAVDRPRLYRPRVRDLRAGRHGKLRRHAGGGDDAGHRREPDLDVLRSVLVAGGGVRLPADHAGGASRRHLRALARERSRSSSCCC